MKRKTTIRTGLAFLFWLGSAASAQADDDVRLGLRGRLAERLDWSAMVEVEWAGDGSSTQKSELVFEPEIEMDLSDGWRLTAIARLRSGDLGDLSPERPRQDAVASLSRRVFAGDHAELELRELYVEGEIGRTYLTLGKQQIVWGKADGLKVLDVVNPQDFREFILDDFDDARIPLWTASAEIPLPSSFPGDGATLQLVWIPDATYHVLPESGSAFELTSPRLVPRPPPGLPVELRPAERPGRLFADADVGARLATFWNGWDVTFNVLYHFDDLPALYRHVEVAGGVPRVVVEPTYERTLLVGGSFSNAFGDFTLRGEVAYSTDRHVSVDDPADADGVSVTGELGYVVGLDWFGLRDTLLSVQLFQSRLDGAPPGLLRRAAETRVTALVRRDFLGERLVAEVLWLHDLDEGDGLVRPKVRWEMRDALELSAGVDVLYGTEDGLFGQFDRNDRLTLGLAWGL